MAHHHTTARLLPVSPDGAVLLLQDQDQDPAVPGVLRWGTIGGAIEAVTGPVGSGTHPFTRNGQTSSRSRRSSPSRWNAGSR